ncbi:MAG: alpha/beta fold hydrolase [Deltaproteobacteria bacterium]|nr:alpha/beta fold hydrolase [Deltaproteobacteria bacterium]
MEELIRIPGPETLEGRYVPGTGGAVIITHPHSLYGGDMDNNVVRIAARAFQARGWATLRFNFRGVGESTGAYGEGRAEAEDVKAALDYVKTRGPAPYLVAGYSFGAYAAAQALLAGLAADGAIFISPPVSFMPMPFLSRVPRVSLIIAGDQDYICPLAELQKLLSHGPHQAEFVVIPGADHFFGGHEAELYQVLLKAGGKKD